MTSNELRARKSWLLSFGDVIALLICFFVMAIAINQSDAQRIHLWIESQLDHSYHDLQQRITDAALTGITVAQDSNGILININTPDAFESAKAIPSPSLEKSIVLLGTALAQTPIFQLEQQYPDFIQQAKAANMHWMTEITVEGYTDNDAIAPTSPLRTNWQLSALRAQAVMQRLQQSSNLPPERFNLAGLSEYHPIVDNDSPKHKAQNRRIQIRINAALLKNELP
jgi:chemotaxis protein MotB